MAGIFGVAGFGKALIPRDQFEVLALATEEHSTQPSVRANFPPWLSLGYCLQNFYGNRPLLRSSDSRWVLLLKGHLTFEGIRSNSSHFLDNFANAINTNPVSVLRASLGSYCGVLVDLGTQNVVLFNDAFGSFALHYSTSAGNLTFGSQSIAVAKACGSALDVHRCGELIEFNQTLGSSTIFAGVERLQPGEVVRYTANTDVVEKTQWGDYSYAGSEESEKQLLEGYANALEASVLASVDLDAVNMALTGGFDSRVMWAALLANGKTNCVRSYTHGLRNSLDITIAARIRRRLSLSGYENVLDPFPFQETPARFHNTVIRSEGSLGIEGTLYQSGWDFQRTRERKVSIDGHGGPLHRRQILKARSRKALSERASAQLLYDVYRSEVSRRTKMTLQGPEALYVCLQQMDRVKEPEDRIDQFYLLGYNANRLSLAGNLQLDQIGLSHPLLSYDLLRYLRRMSVSVRRRSKPYRHFIDTRAKVLREFPLEDHGFSVNYSGSELLRYFPLVLERLQRPLKRVGISLIQSRPAVDISVIHESLLTTYVELISSSEVLEPLVGVKALALATTRADTLHDLAKWTIYFDHLRSEGFKL